jgi:SSS family solute:Na+ symporter
MLASMFPGKISVNVGIAITAVAFIVVCLLGGLFGASLANLINVIVIYAALIACLIAAIAGLGGLEGFIASAKAIPESTTNGGSWLSLTGGLSLATCLSYFVSEPGNRISTQSNTQCALAAKDAKTARWGIIIAALCTIPICFISALIGIIAKIQFPEAATAQAMSLVITSLNPFLSGLGLAGLWAVNVSSGVALLMACVQLLCYDVIAPLRKDKSKPISKTHSRIVLLILGIITLLCAYIATDIVKTLTILLCITPAFFLGMIGMMYFPKLLKKRTMVLTQAAAYIFFVAWLFIPAVKSAFPTPIYVEWPLCVVVFFLCYLFDKEPITIPQPREGLE